MTPNNGDSDLLRLHEHVIEAAVVHEGAVLRWRCVECGLEHADAEDYLEVRCDPDAVR